MRLALLAVVIAAGCAVALFLALDILPPDRLRFAAGRDGGGYHAVAQRYAAVLARDGIVVEIVETAGSVENAGLLEAGEADVALLQGGVDPAPEAGIEALAGVFLEPFLAFHATAVADAADPAAWTALRVAAGEPGGGTRAAVEAVLGALDLRAAPEALLALGGADAARALLAGELDVAIFVAPIQAAYLERLLASDDVALAPIRDAQALARRLPYVRIADIPASGLDYARRRPEQAIPLAAMVARLAARPDLHPALVDRLIAAAERIHAGPTMLSDDLRFPKALEGDLPMNAQAAARLREGPSPLHDVLPYWATAQINRLALALLPVLVVLLPLLRALPGLYAWRMRARVYRRYDELMEIDHEIEGAAPTPERRAALCARLDAIDDEARAVSVPARYREYAYTLRMHVDLLRRKLDAA